MKERIYSIETEYAIGHVPHDGSEKMNESELFDCLFAALSETYKFQGLKSRAAFLENGSKLYYDCGHAEWCLPECRSVRELMIFDKAAERSLEECLPAAQNIMKKNGYPGEIFIRKNNTDAFGNTYGTHENYLMQRQTDFLDNGKDFFKILIRHLVPFLVTRQIICGSGKVGFDDSWGNKGTGFQISQRADFINCVIGAETTNNRPIINLKDEPFAHGQTYRRLHLILGDANMSEWSGFLKVGTTGIILRLIEANFISGDLSLDAPATAAKEISADLSCKRKVLLKDGRRLTPAQIQRNYLESAKEYFKYVEPSIEELEILKIWEDTLDKLELDPMQLHGRLDWVIKKNFLDYYMNKNKISSWDDPRLKEIDMNFHDVCKEKSLYYILEKMNLVEKQTFIYPNENPGEIRQAQFKPPLYTRAGIRNDILRAVKSGNIDASVDWNYVQWTHSGKKVWLNDPLCFFDQEIHRNIHGNKSPTYLKDILDCWDPGVLLRLLHILPQVMDKNNISIEEAAKLFKLAESKNPEIKLKAIETLDMLFEKNKMPMDRDKQGG